MHITTFTAPTVHLKDLFPTSPFSIRAISRLSWSGLHTQTNSPKEEHHQKPDSKSSSHLIALQNPQLTFQVCAEFPYLCTICCGCTTCFLKDLSQPFMALHYLLTLHTLLFEGFFSSFHRFALSAATANLAF
jgi:hypothetical protein